MRNKISIFICILLISMFIGGCVQPKEEETDSNNDIGISEPNDDVIENPTNGKQEGETATSIATFVGFSDNNSLEVIDEEKGFIVFYKNGAYEEYNKLLKTGDKIEVQYFGEEEQNIIKNLKVISSIKSEITIQTKEVVYIGLIDNNSFEVDADGTPLVLRLEEAEKKIETLKIRSNDKTEITWYQNENDQLILLWISRIE